MATKKYAFKMSTSEGTYFVDSETGEFLDDISGYEVLSFGNEVEELPDLDDIQETTKPEDYGPVQPKEPRETSGSGDVISRRTPRDDVLRPIDPRRDVVEPTSRAGKLASKGMGLVGSKALAGVGAALGMGVAGPLGAMAGGLLGNLAGGKIGSFIANDMVMNPQTMALPGKSTRTPPKAVPKPENAVRTNPLLAPVTPVSRAPLEAPRSGVTPVVAAPVSPVSSAPLPAREMTFEDVSFNQPSRPVTPTPARNTPGAPVGRVDRAPLGGVTAAPTTRSNPLFGTDTKVTTPDQPVNPMTSAQSRQVMPSLDYGRFSRTEAPQVNWNGYDPAQLDPYTRDKVEQAQSKLDFSLTVTSGFRDPARNKAAGGAKGSQHQHGRAVDISLKGLDDSQRADVVAALGSVSEPGKGRVGAYSGNTGLHYDTAEHSTQGYGGMHPMYDKSIRNIERAPGWFSTGLKAVEAKDWSSLEKRAPRDPFSQQAIEATQPKARETPTAGRYTNTPGTYTSSGLYNRSDEEKAMMGFTIAGELSGKTLRGLQENDPQARAELANVVATMENRAHSTRYDGQIKDALSPSQYNSLTKGALNTTRNNWGAFGEDITRSINDYYAGVNKPTTPDATHYANYDVVTPSWDHAAINKTKVGDHTFSTVTIPGTKQAEYAPSPAFQAQFDQAITDEVNKQTKESFNIGRTAITPVTSENINAAPRTTSISSTMTTGYPTTPGFGFQTPEKQIEKVMKDTPVDVAKEVERSGLLGDVARDATRAPTLDRISGLMNGPRTTDWAGTGGYMSRSNMDALGVSKDYAGGLTSVSDGGGVSYSRANGSTRNPDGTAYDPWSGMRNSGVMGGSSRRGSDGGGFGSGTVSDAGKEAAKGGGGLF